MNRIKTVFLVCLIMALAIIAGCSQKTTNEAEDGTKLYQIDTEIIPLQYPERWESNMRVQVDVTPDGGTAAFYATINEHAEELVFTVFFNGDADAIPIGTLKKTGTVEIAFQYAEPEFDETWSGDEIVIFNTMQEDVNYLIHALWNNGVEQ